jgi:hypothetical protein
MSQPLLEKKRKFQEMFKRASFLEHKHYATSRLILHPEQPSGLKFILEPETNRLKWQIQKMTGTLCFFPQKVRNENYYTVKTTA